MRSRIINLTKCATVRVFLAFLLFLGALFVIALPPQNAYAEPASTDPVVAHCQKVLSSKVQSACLNQDNITHARNAASYHCTKKPAADNQKADCIRDLANKYIDSAAAKHPRTAAQFESALNNVLDDAIKGTGGSVSTPSPDAGVQTGTFNTGIQSAKDHQCGSGDNSKVNTSIDFGCRGDVCVKSPSDSFCTTEHNAILDLAFAIIRFLSNGAGLFIIGSLVFGGIQYTYSRGDPQALAAAENRIRTVLISLGIYIFAYAILNYLIPGALLK